MTDEERLESLPPDAYWGGYTENGLLLHLAVPSRGVSQFARSACGLLLTGGAWDIPAQMRSERCKRCVAVTGRRLEEVNDGV